MSRLLVIACSAKKRKDAEPLAALDRYDGPAFRVLRNYLAAATTPPKVIVLSAKYGLIDGSQTIRDYDLRLTAKAADAVRPRIVQALERVLGRSAHSEIGFCLGKMYRRAIAGYEAVIPEGTDVTTIQGGLGLRLRNLREWLLAAEPSFVSDQTKGGSTCSSSQG
jgi:hypothetical protein